MQRQYLKLLYLLSLRTDKKKKKTLLGNVALKHIHVWCIYLFTWRRLPTARWCHHKYGSHYVPFPQEAIMKTVFYDDEVIFHFFVSLLQVLKPSTESLKCHAHNIPSETTVKISLAYSLHQPLVTNCSSMEWADFVWHISKLSFVLSSPKAESWCKSCAVSSLNTLKLSSKAQVRLEFHSWSFAGLRWYPDGILETSNNLVSCSRGSCFPHCGNFNIRSREFCDLCQRRKRRRKFAYIPRSQGSGWKYWQTAAWRKSSARHSWS